jgi:hypothetical protein
MTGLASRDEIERLKRGINLVEYACSRAGYQIDLKESSPRGNPTHWILRRPSDGSKLLALRGPKCWLYFDLKQHGPDLRRRKAIGDGYGTIVDFVQEQIALPKGRGSRSFGLVVRELREYAGVSPTPPATAFSVHPPSRQERLPSPEVASRWNAAREPNSSSYLASRGLLPSTLAHPRFTGVWRVDDRQNVLFAHRDCDARLVGFEIKNHNFTSYPRGGVRTGLWRSNAFPGDRYLLLTESAINALSFDQLHPDRTVRYMSFGGRIGSGQLAALECTLRSLGRNVTILLAFDGAGDEAGAHYERQVRNILPAGLRAETTHPPSEKDWNDYLQSVQLGR